MKNLHHPLIPVLCVMDGSNYRSVPGLDLYDKDRDAYTYDGTGKTICHPPCQQWSRLKAFARADKKEKELALFCYDLVIKHGGILEHPKGSSLFKYVNADRKKMFSVQQNWWGFPCKKDTILFCNDVELLPFPLSLDLVTKTVQDLTPRHRSLMPLSFCNYLANSVKASI
jgi:hypothetical protein